ncbi:MAG: sulfatase-like hydrolase/transferase, partial [Candidatus Eisenbacteria bacterium]
DGEIAYMDSEIGRLLDALGKNGFSKNTLVVAVADHGEGLGEHDEATHTMLIYESTIRVPLILSCRGVFRGPYIAGGGVVSTADVFPTVLDLLGALGERAVDGKSLLGPLSPDRAIYIETLAPYFDAGWSPIYGLRRHGDKYILAPRPEYYDLRADPEEKNNLAGGSGPAREVADALASELEARLARGPSLEEIAASTEPLDLESRLRLEALGYVSGAALPDSGEPLPDPKEMMPVLGLLDRANIYLRAGRLDQALDSIRRAADRSPRNREVLRTMGKVFLFMERDGEAEDTLRAALALRPHPDICLLIAQLMIKQDRREEARGMLAQAAALDPMHGGVEIARGDLLMKEGKPGEAIAAYRRAAEIDPYRVGDAARARLAAASRRPPGTAPR